MDKDEDMQVSCGIKHVDCIDKVHEDARWMHNDKY